LNRIGDVMVSVLSSSAVDRVFEHRSGQIKDYIIGRKSKYWLALNQDNVSEWCNMYIHGLLFQWSSTIKNQTKRAGLVQSGPHHHLIPSSQLTCSRHEIAETLALNNNHSLSKVLFHLFLVRSNIKERKKMQLSIFNVYDD
jgi:hypothetical protein